MAAKTQTKQINFIRKKKKKKLHQWRKKQHFRLLRLNVLFRSKLTTTGEPGAPTVLSDAWCCQRILILIRRQN